MLGKISSNFDWVEERLKCSLDVVFETFRCAVETDVKSRNAQLTSDIAVFKIANSSGLFTVFRNTGRYESFVRFEKTDESIKVIDPGSTYSDSKVIANATLTLNNDGECRLKVGDEELEFWQFPQNRTGIDILQPQAIKNDLSRRLQGSPVACLSSKLLPLLRSHDVKDLPSRSTPGLPASTPCRSCREASIDI